MDRRRTQGAVVKKETARWLRAMRKLARGGDVRENMQAHSCSRRAASTGLARIYASCTRCLMR